MTDPLQPDTAPPPLPLQRFADWLLRKEILGMAQLIWLSMIFAACGAYLLAYSQEAIALVGCAVFIQLRLLCDLLGRMMHEHGEAKPKALLWHELSDRFSDGILLVALGYAIGHGWLGWLTAMLAAGTAHIRLFGNSTGLPVNYAHTMGKSFRMLVMTAGCLLGAIENHFSHSNFLLGVTIVTLCIGSVIACFFRIRRLLDALNLQEELDKPTEQAAVWQQKDE